MRTTDLFVGVFRAAVLNQLAKLQEGSIEVDEDGSRQLFGQPGSGLQARVVVHDSTFWGAVATQGSIGAGESYVRGHWSSPDLTTVVRVLIRNLDVLDDMEGGLAS